MLKRLYIKNFAIIEELEIEFSEKLNIITGETGAGKSIILGALGLIKGERASSQMVRNETSKSIIEAEFDLSKANLEHYFETHELEFQKNTLIRRELMSEGKTRAFINDSPVNLSILSELGNKLIEIHSQHDSLELKSSEYQLEILDAFAENEDLLQALKIEFQLLKTIEKEYQMAIESQSKTQAERELQQYHFQELSQFDFSEWKLEQLEEELNLSENSLEIKQQLQASVQAFQYAEVNMVDGLREILIRMRKLDKYSKELSAINENLDDVISQLIETSREYEHLMEKIDFDEASLEELRIRFSFIQKMQKKHQLKTLEELIEYKNGLETALNWAENIGDTILNLEQKLVIHKEKALSLANKISKKRKAICSSLESKLLKNLSELELGNSQFKIEINSDSNRLNETGFDSIQFLFTANTGSPLRELKNAISGGEMSRFMLAIKSLLAEKIQLSTLIFDEIDTGVSGLVANRVATMLSKLSQSHQIIAITHLPQIASKGFHHFKVYKETDNNITATRIKQLHQADREIEIAHMISGESITQASLTSAKELLSQA